MGRKFGQGNTGLQRLFLITDMWSFACIVFELATGDLMFAPSSVQGYSDDEFCLGRRIIVEFDDYWEDKHRRNEMSVLFSLVVGKGGGYNWGVKDIIDVKIDVNKAHLAQMMELLGKMPRKIAAGGSRWKSFFDRYGDLKRIRRLKFCPLDRLLVEKYNFLASDARE
ncbi:hypothetical protein Syun_014982 [Stephania yunnanensis]|uniref:non-specific serine/threonine protein kinase n=1 Tax=Stephania yunnanensis TaxID=152371 RepID=A0AAP0P9A2_9MAGN